MKTAAIVILLCGVLLGCAKEPPNCDVNSNYQSGGVTACNVGQVEIAQADVHLRLRNHESPVLQIINDSQTTASTVAYGMALWNLDNPQDIQPLQIPFNTVGFIHPHAKGVQIDFIHNLPGVVPPHDGTKLFGSMGVSCANCQTGHTYWVYIEWGRAGWYSETKILNGDSGDVLVPPNGEGFKPDVWAAQMMATVSQVRRVPISP